MTIPEIVTFKGKAGIRGFTGRGLVPGRAISAKYGLSIPDPGVLTKPELEAGIHRHDLVTNYLETHPEVARRYKPDQTGAVGYYDVLALAEADEARRGKGGPPG